MRYIFHGSRGLISSVKSVKSSQTQGRGNKFNLLIIDVWVCFFSDIVKLIIRVTDVNDNKPRFSTSSYQASIPANLKHGSKVVQLSATDLDSGANRLLYYTIKEGNKDGIFEIKNDNGLITLGNRPLASALQDTFTLIVEAADEKDRNKKDEATVLINVFPPDGPPRYPDPSLSFDIQEGILAGQKIASAAAATTEYVIYTILSGNEDGVIQIDPFSGDLVTAQELDYEIADRYELHVMAQDIKGRKAEVKITINVIDINDNSPFFIDEVKGKVDQRATAGARAGDEVAQIVAYDLDNESSMKYKLSPDAEAYIDIDDQGIIRAKRTLDGTIPGKRSTEPLRTLNFNLEARDGANPPNSVTTPVRLAFTNDQAGQNTVALRVREDTPVGKVFAVTPRYIPGGKFSILYPEETPFSVDEEGRIQLKTSLDFETQAVYTLTVREEAFTSSGPIFNDINFEISVVDVNDNDPRFELRQRHGTVNGNAQAGASALKLYVSDADTDANGLAGYQLVTSNAPFGIDPLEDTLKVGGPLMKSQYDLEIRSFDYGVPRRQNSPLKLRLDVGQLPPRFIDFHDDGYKFEVPEDARGGTVIGKIQALSVSGSRVGYKISDGNSGNRFRINSDGEIMLNFLLDYETQAKEYELQVEAIEMIPSGLISSIDVKILVLNANDHHPMFEQGSYTATVPEDAAFGSSILTVAATDCDCSQDCSCSSGQLSYSVKDTEYFTVDPDTGVISPARSLDYERIITHIFQVRASDHLRNKTNVALAYVKINVTNVNDNQPRFANPEYSFSVDEDAQVGIGLAVIEIHDDDHDEITYSIVQGSSPFTIDARTGVISLSRKLPSSPWEYTFTIRGTDSNGAFSDAKVFMTIRDKNNNRPVFEKCEDSTVTENLSPGQVVTQIVATDVDRGLGGEVEYSLAYGDEFFEIDNTTGVLKATVTFDREEKAEYKVVIKVEDGGHGRSSSERLLRYCKLEVIIGDVNDNYPYFPVWTYEGSVWNNAEIGTSVMRVHAFDSDAGVNANVEYHLEPDDKFEISERGVISTKVSLASFTGKMTLTVLPSNTEPMTAGADNSADRSTNIEIFVSDLPPPEFTKAIYTASVQENQVAGKWTKQKSHHSHFPCNPSIISVE